MSNEWRIADGGNARQTDRATERHKAVRDGRKGDCAAPQPKWSMFIFNLYAATTEKGCPMYRALVIHRDRNERLGKLPV